VKVRAICFSLGHRIIKERIEGLDAHGTPK
jgi:hypothetical protein